MLSKAYQSVEYNIIVYVSFTVNSFKSTDIFKPLSVFNVHNNVLHIRNAVNSDVITLHILVRLAGNFMDLVLKAVRIKRFSSFRITQIRSESNALNKRDTK